MIGSGALVLALLVTAGSSAQAFPITGKVILDKALPAAVAFADGEAKGQANRSVNWDTGYLVESTPPTPLPIGIFANGYNGLVFSDAQSPLTLGVRARALAGQLSLPGDQSAFADADLVYFFEAKSSTPGPIDLTFTATIDWSATVETAPRPHTDPNTGLLESEQSSIDVTDVATNATVASFGSPFTDAAQGGGSQAVNTTLVLQPNTLYEMNMVAKASVDCAAAPLGFNLTCASGSLDEAMEEGFIVPKGATLFVSANLGRLSAPEPGTWTMMLIGLGGLGAAMRTRRPPVLRLTPDLAVLI